MTHSNGFPMDSGRFFFDGSSCNGNMLFLGKRDHVFQGQRSVMSIEEPSKRGFFFGSSDDLIDDEFYDEQSPEKKRRLTSEQVLLLEKSFETENKLEPDRKTQLANKLGLQPRQVAVWFQNRRARWKTKQLERDYDLLKSSYDSLLSDYDTIIKENEKLKTEVVSLTEKLQVKEVTGMVVVSQKSDHPQLSFANAASTDVLAIQFNVKTEDPLSSGTGGSSSVVDEDGPQLVDSGDSYFPNDDVYNGYMGHVDGVQSEEDDGSDDNRSCYWAVASAEHQQQEQHETEPLSWWIWP